jgi:adenylate cyclase
LLVRNLLKGGRKEQVLPARVRDAIQAQEDRTERLIGWLQFCVVLLFGALYVISPKTYPVDPPFEPVPWALAFYLILTLVRIFWASRGRLPDWSLAVSVFFDIGLLMLLIWSFHVQYGQPASFYLKAPTLLYVFIFIALRALRFDWRFVVLTGVAAAMGWGAMILYVVQSEGGGMMITRDYIEYMTSNAILLGAEFDKMISMLVVAVLLGVALARGRDLLIRAVSESIAAQELSRFFAPQVADRIKGSERGITAGTADVCDAAILNLDMRGFTRLAETLPPERVLAVLAAYQRRLVPVIQKHGGSIDKFLGDGIMATFGAAEPSETFAADAMRALDEVVEVAADWQQEGEATNDLPHPRINAALATGRILFGAVGDDSRLEITVIGDAANLSAKLEKHNKEVGSTALVTAEAYELALGQGYEPPRSPRRLPDQRVGGVGQALDLVEPLAG